MELKSFQTSCKLLQTFTKNASLQSKQLEMPFELKITNPAAPFQQFLSNIGHVINRTLEVNQKYHKVLRYLYLYAVWDEFCKITLKLAMQCMIKCEFRPFFIKMSHCCQFCTDFNKIWYPDVKLAPLQFYEISGLNWQKYLIFVRGSFFGTPCILYKTTIYTVTILSTTLSVTPFLLYNFSFFQQIRTTVHQN